MVLVCRRLGEFQGRGAWRPGRRMERRRLAAAPGIYSTKIICSFSVSYWSLHRPFSSFYLPPCRPYHVMLQRCKYTHRWHGES